MKLQNSLSKRLEDFEPREGKTVSLYTCGPTVYDHAHIGNLRTYIFEDTLRRSLRLQGYQVDHVMNITDIDDKTIVRSQAKYPKDQPAAALAKLAQHYLTIFLTDSSALGINLDDSRIEPATEHIDDIKSAIAKIPNKYVADDGVYFDLSHCDDYGVLTQLDRSHQHHRINNDDYDKEHVADFALWKLKQGNEPAWEFKLDDKQITGRPGWHIECSAIIASSFKSTPIDIHTGGVDLKFPHHENEIAQHQAAYKRSLARFFVHAEHLLVDGKKMSKRLKNFYTLADIQKWGFSPLAFRLLVLQAHYRKQLNFTKQSLAAAQSFLQDLYGLSDRQFQSLPVAADSELMQLLAKLSQQIRDQLAHDLDTPDALTALSRLSDYLSIRPLPQANLGHFKQFMALAEEAFGLGLSQRLPLGEELAALLTSRETARQNNDFATADKLRVELVRQGIELRDTDFGVVWQRTIP